MDLSRGLGDVYKRQGDESKGSLILDRITGWTGCLRVPLRLSPPGTLL
jgi:hypothetical protein